MRRWLALGWLLAAGCAEPTSNTAANVRVAPTAGYYIRCADVPDVPLYVSGLDPVRACTLLERALAGFARLSPDSVPPADLADLEGATIQPVTLLLVPPDPAYTGIQGAVWSVDLLPRGREYLLSAVASRGDGREAYHVQRNVILTPEARPRWPAIPVVGQPTLHEEPSPVARRLRADHP